ncbi:helix-turn-helix domain of transposase IS66 family protein [Escherichia coli 8-415-05_S1_C2]|nr:helix-turn-helix domain of transposase IS66 family protein [Escherichia coli 8-415-05_S1_C1]KEO09851.1 helix-turn-helix domain of transposase IS66 family protein [Escherichia coli 8-415-05_S1_C2]
MSEQLELISSAFKVIETQRPKQACCRCDHIVQVSIHKITWPVTAVCFRPMLTVVTGRYTNPAE